MDFLGIISWSLFVDVLRWTSIFSFILCSLSFTWYSFAGVISILVSLYVLDRNKYISHDHLKQEQFPFQNPYKRKRRVKDEERLDLEVVNKYIGGILDLVLYDVENCEAVHNFQVIKNNTDCIFSKKAILWGARDYDPELSIEHNVTRSLPALLKFLTIGSDLLLDGFLFELPGQRFCKDIEVFGEGVRSVLKCISDADPSGYCCMNKSFLPKRGWGFEFARYQIFVTTFSACYSEKHSRYTFGVDSSFILLQPMYSFALHNISPETPHTNWQCPQTERDYIRVAYKTNSRGYLIRDTVIYPTAHDIVKPLIEGPGIVQEWWKEPSKGEGTRGGKEREMEDTPSGEREHGNVCKMNQEDLEGTDVSDNQEDKKNI